MPIKQACSPWAIKYLPPGRICFRPAFFMCSLLFGRRALLCSPSFVFAFWFREGVDFNDRSCGVCSAVFGTEIVCILVSLQCSVWNRGCLHSGFRRVELNDRSCGVCSAVFGNEIWPAAEYGRTMYTIRQRMGPILMRMEKRYGIGF